jgi:hypothetical protein
MGTFWILLAVCGLLEYFYFKQKWNVLLSIITAVSWLGLMTYTLTNPPTNIIAGSFLQELLILVFLGGAFFNLYMWFRNRDSKFSDTGKSEYTESEERERNVNSGNRSLMSMNETEYKAYIRSKRRTTR